MTAYAVIIALVGRLTCADLIAKESDRTLAVRVDVTSKADVDAMAAAAIDRFGGIDVLVSTAGFGIATPFDDLGIDEWRSAIDTNLTSAYLGAKACAASLIEHGGSIVHTASASGLGGDAGLNAYNGCGSLACTAVGCTAPPRTGGAVDVAAPDWPSHRMLLSTNGGRFDGPPGTHWVAHLPRRLLRVACRGVLTVPGAASAWPRAATSRC